MHQIKDKVETWFKNYNKEYKKSQKLKSRMKLMRGRLDI